MAHPNEDLVREGFAAFGRGDMDAMRKQFFAEDVRWHVSGPSSLAGALYTARGEREGKQLNDNEVLVYHVRDGKVSEVWGYGTDPYAFDRFWS